MAASRGTHAHGEQMAAAGETFQQVQLAVPQLGIEQHQRSRTRTDDRYHLLDRGERVERISLLGTKKPVGVAFAVCGQPCRTGTCCDTRRRTAVGDENDLLIRDESPAANSGGVFQAHTCRPAVVHDVRCIDASSLRGPIRHGKRRHHQAGQRQAGACQQSSRKSGEDCEIEIAADGAFVKPRGLPSSRHRQQPYAGCDASDGPHCGGIGERDRRQHGDFVRGIGVVAQEGCDGRASSPAQRDADKPLERPAVGRRCCSWNPEHGERSPLAQLRDKRNVLHGQRSGDHQIDSRRGHDLLERLHIQIRDELDVDLACRSGDPIAQCSEGGIGSFARLGWSLGQEPCERSRRKQGKDDQAFGTGGDASKRGVRPAYVAPEFHHHQCAPVSHACFTPIGPGMTMSLFSGLGQNPTQRPPCNWQLSRAGISVRLYQASIIVLLDGDAPW